MRKILSCLVLVFLTISPVLGDVVDEARELLRKERPEQAFKLLREAVTNERLKQARFKLVLADAARLYAPHIPLLNGGDRSQVQAYLGAGEFYQQILASEEADKTDKLLAELGLTNLKQAMINEAKGCFKQGGIGQMHRLAEAISGLWPDDPTGPSLVYEAGVEAQESQVQLQGLRGMVATGIKSSSTYALAAMLERDEEIGDGADAALKHLERGLAVIPGEVSLLDAKARLLIQLGREEQALATLAVLDEATQKTQDEKERARAVAAAGAHYDHLGRSAEAMERYQWAAERLPETLPLRVALGTLHFQRAAETRSKLDHSQDSEALNSQMMESLRRAKTELEYAHKHGKPDVTVMLALSEIYQRLGDMEAALAMQRDVKKVRNGESIR